MDEDMEAAKGKPHPNCWKDYADCCVIMLNVIIPNVFMSNVIMLNVI